MRALHEIFDAAERLAPILGMDWPLSADALAQDATEQLSQPVVAQPQDRLSAIEGQLEYLKQEVFSRVSGPIFHAEIAQVGSHIAQLWEAIAERPQLSPLASAELLWRVQQGSLTQRSAQFSEALLALAGLDSFDSWMSVYWPSVQKPPNALWTNRSFFSSLLSSGDIDLLNDLDSIDDAAFVRTCYNCILGRPTDPDGFSSLVRSLGEGWTRRMVMDELLNSPEAENRENLGMDLGCFRRSADDRRQNFLSALKFLLIKTS